MHTMTALPATSARGLRAETLLAGLSLGVAWDLLFAAQGLFDSGMGGLVLWVALAGVLTLWLNRNASAAWRRVLAMWSALALAATLPLLLRATEALIPFSFLVLLGCAAAVLLQADGTRLREATAAGLLRSALRLPAQILRNVWAAPAQWRQESRSGDTAALAGTRSARRERLGAVLRGALLAAPLLFVFVGLFSSADAGFERFASRIGDLLARDMRQHVLVSLLMGVISTGLLSCATPRAPSTAPRQSPRALGDIELAILLGSLCLLFVAFVVVQLPTLFAARETLAQVAGLSVADFARRGFFQLLVAALLSLVLLLGLSALQTSPRLFRPLALLLVSCVLVILASAAQRLLLYVESFGLTLDRVLAIACMAWLAVLLPAFAATVLRGKPQGFGAALLLSGIGVVLLLGAANPAARVAEVNLARASEKPATLDVNYLLALGADTTPALLSHLDIMTTPQRCEVARALLPLAQQSVTDWRRWNAGTVRAQRLVAARELELREIQESAACRLQVMGPAFRLR